MSCGNRGQADALRGAFVPPSLDKPSRIGRFQQREWLAEVTVVPKDPQGGQDVGTMVCLVFQQNGLEATNGTIQRRCVTHNHHVFCLLFLGYGL